MLVRLLTAATLKSHYEVRGTGTLVSRMRPRLELFLGAGQSAVRRTVDPSTLDAEAIRAVGELIDNADVTLPSQARRPSPRKPCLVVIDECALRGRQRCHDRSVVHAMPFIGRTRRGLAGGRSLLPGLLAFAMRAEPLPPGWPAQVQYLGGDGTQARVAQATKKADWQDCPG
jgi:hypothetical protein